MSLSESEIAAINAANAARHSAAKKAAAARRRCKHKPDGVTSKVQDDGMSRVEACGGCNSIRILSLDGTETYADWYFL